MAHKNAKWDKHTQLWSQHLGGAEAVQLLKPDLHQDLSETGKMLVFVTHL